MPFAALASLLAPLLSGIGAGAGGAAAGTAAAGAGAAGAAGGTLLGGTGAAAGGGGILASLLGSGGGGGGGGLAKFLGGLGGGGQANVGGILGNQGADLPLGGAETTGLGGIAELLKGGSFNFANDKFAIGLGGLRDGNRELMDRLLSQLLGNDGSQINANPETETVAQQSQTIPVGGNTGTSFGRSPGTGNVDTFGPSVPRIARRQAFGNLGGGGAEFQNMFGGGGLDLASLLQGGFRR